MSAWKYFPHDIPNDGEEVWCSLNNWYGPRFLATYNLSSQVFTTTDNGLSCYWFSIARWRSQ